MAQRPQQQPRRSRVAHLLKTYYDIEVDAEHDPSRTDPSNIDGIAFDANAHFARMLREKHLNTLVKESKELSHDVKALEGDLQMLVYENYNKFISATDTIRKMKDNVSCLEGELSKLSGFMQDINESSDVINTNLADSRAKIEQLNAVRGLVKKLQFVFELPSKLNRAVSCEAYTQAVNYYTMASQILDQNSHIPTFRSIKDEADDIMHRLRAQMREVLRKEDINKSQMSELISLLLKLEEDHVSLRTLFINRWSRDILAKIEELKKSLPTDTETMVFVRQVHEAAIKNTVRFTSDFTSLFLESKLLDEKAVNKARTNLDNAVIKLVNAYLELLHIVLQGDDVNGSVVVEVLQQVELNTRGLLACIPHLEVLTEKYQEFANTALAREIKKATAPCEAVFTQVLDSFRRTSLDVHNRRTSPQNAQQQQQQYSAQTPQTSTASPSNSNSNSNPGSVAGFGSGSGHNSLSLSSSFYSLVLSSASQICECLKQLCDELNVMIDCGGADHHLVDMTANLISVHINSLHSTFLSRILGVGGMVDTHPNFAIQHRPPQPLSAHTISVLLCSSLCVCILEKNAWDPIVSLPLTPHANTKHSRGTRDIPMLTPSTVTQSWQQASEMLLSVFVNWSSQLGAEISIAELAWAAGEPGQVSRGIVHVINHWWFVYGDVLGAFNLQRDLPKEENIRFSSDDERLCSARGAGALIEKDIARMFSQEKSVALTGPCVNPQSVISHVVQKVIKSLTEHARQQIEFELAGLHQVQVDVRCMRLCVHLLDDEAPSTSSLLDEMLMSAADRCLQPSPADNKIVEDCVAKARSSFPFLPKTAPTLA